MALEEVGTAFEHPPIFKRLAMGMSSSLSSTPIFSFSSSILTTWLLSEVVGGVGDGALITTGSAADADAADAAAASGDDDDDFDDGMKAMGGCDATDGLCRIGGEAVAVGGGLLPSSLDLLLFAAKAANGISSSLSFLYNKRRGMDETGYQTSHDEIGDGNFIHHTHPSSTTLTLLEEQEVQ